MLSFVRTDDEAIRICRQAWRSPHPKVHQVHIVTRILAAWHSITKIPMIGDVHP
ncbi:hypothetical protein [Nostoc sp. UHCC 0252]|uniref:hypothetical protein n=1 Tax=Nostoc sp. UHCC 0252 TaxID=3110241 RepID=UPI002B216A8E|nr:hypothetical protein [Nostoc sp. UHCC 0252]MEA5606272.1 hypothetical protein [Nostoc sp. UHCC 0252]